MIQRILVLGGGSAGFLAAISLKIKLPDLQVSVVRSTAMGVIGVDEATTFAFPNYLHRRLRIDPGEFHRQAQPTWKLGIRFLNWGHAATSTTPSAPRSPRAGKTCPGRTATTVTRTS